MLGAILSDQHEFRAAMDRLLSLFVTVFFLPIFFTYTGLRTNIGTLNTATHWILLLGVLGCAVAGKLGGIAGRPGTIYPKKRTRGLFDALTSDDSDTETAISRILTRRPRFLFQW